MSEQLDLLADLSRRAGDAGTRAAVSDPEASAWLTERALPVLEHLSETGVPFTSDDVRERAGDPPTSAAMGAALRVAAGRRLIVRVGYRPARRPSRHGAIVAVWQGRRP